MIKNILYVEDGSVDVDEVQNSLGNDTTIIVYRQGTKPPFLEQLPEPIFAAGEDIVKHYKHLLDETVKKVERMLDRCLLSDLMRDELTDLFYFLKSEVK